MVPSKKTLSSTVADMVPAVLLVILGFWLINADGQHGQWSEDTWRSWLWRHRYQTIIGLSFTAMVTPVIWLIANIVERRRAIRAFLDHVHARFWTRESRKDSEYRISLYVPDWTGEALVCRFRTDDTPAGERWSALAPADGRVADGVVGAAWLTGMVVQADSPPKNPTDDELRDYRLRCYINTREGKERSWPVAAQLAIPVHSPDGKSLGVLLFERNRPESKVGGVTIRDYEHDVHVVAMILERSL